MMSTRGASDRYQEQIHQGRIVAQYREARHWTQQRLAEELGVDLRTVQRMEQRPMIKSLKRRELLVKLLGIPAVLMGLESETQQPRKTVLLLNEDPMSFLENELVTHWEVYHIGGTLRAVRGLDRWMSEASNFARSTQGTGWQGRSHAVLAMSYQLQGNITRDMMQYPVAHHAYQQALRVARELDDPELLATALLREGFVFFHEDKPAETIEYLQAALQLINGRGFPRLRAQILGALSEAQAKAHLPSECWRTIDLLEYALQQQNHLRERTHFLFRAIPIIEQKAINAALLGDYDRALALIDKRLAVYDPTLIRGRAKLMIQKAEIYYQLGEIDECVTFAREAFSLARAVGSEKRIGQVRNLHATLATSKWGNERGVASLGALLAGN